MARERRQRAIFHAKKTFPSEDGRSEVRLRALLHCKVALCVPRVPETPWFRETGTKAKFVLLCVRCFTQYLPKRVLGINRRKQLYVHKIFSSSAG